MRNLFTRTIVAVLHDRKGISAMEYAILAAAVLAAVSTAAFALGTDIGAMFIRLETLMIGWVP